MNGPRGAVRVVVDGVGDQLLAGAVLALNQDVRVAHRHALDQLEQILHHPALPDDVGKAVLPADLLAQVLMLGALLVAIRRLSEQIDETVLRHRLLEEEERAGPPGFDRAVDRALRRRSRWSPAAGRSP